MLTDELYNRVLSYLDTVLRDRKVTETSFDYFGLTLDYYFNDSVLSVDYLDLDDYMNDSCGVGYLDSKCFVEQYSELRDNNRIHFLESVLTILKNSKYDTIASQEIIDKVVSVLKRCNLKIIEDNSKKITIARSDILDNGYYCNIILINDKVVRKELKPIHANDEKLKKRMKYEYENMCKLQECPYILNVIEFDKKNCSYLMERGDKNLYDYLKEKPILSFESKLKIIKDILEGMAYAHSKNIIHRDLHLGNVLKMNQDYVICDFGLSKDLSIQRSLQSSMGNNKNSHLFLDPCALGDFSKLDKRSDIYSIGIMINYLLTYNTDNSNHIFKSIVERCICRDKELRYDSVRKIIEEMDATLALQNDEDSKQKIINDVLHSIYNSQVQNLVMDLVGNDKLCNFIIKYKLSKFGKLVIQFETYYQEIILDTILQGYSEATGYNGWKNYDIFADIAYYICTESKEIKIRQKAKILLKECAQIRWYAEGLLNKVQF